MVERKEKTNGENNRTKYSDRNELCEMFGKKNPKQGVKYGIPSVGKQ